MPYSAYKKVNPSSQIIIDGSCNDGCTNLTPIYAYSIYYTNEKNSTLSSNPVWINLNSVDELASGIFFKYCI